MAKKPKHKTLRPTTRNRKRKIPLILVLLILAAAGVGGYFAWKMYTANEVDVRIGSQVFRLEVAADAAAREAGLSNRQSLDSDKGMLFIYATPTRVNFWMKDTSIPLTAAYLDESGTILALHDLEPLSETGIPSGEPIKYVVELNQGAFEQAGAAVGDAVVSVSGKEKFGLGF